MKVLLTGYSGFLGHYVFKALKNKGASVRVFLHRHTVAMKELGADTEVIWGTFDNPNAVKRAVDGVDCVVHSAWAFSSPFEERPTLNERGTAIIFSESVNAGVKKFVFVSSVAVYGMSATAPSLIKESNQLAKDKNLQFIYPSEKITIEKTLQEFDRREIALAIFRPGPIFDETKGPANKVLRIGPWWFGLGIGNGRNQMPFIHAKDVADAVVRWLEYGDHAAIFNVVPSKCMRATEWIRAWGLQNNLDLHPFFIPGSIVRLASFGANVLKNILGRKSKTDVKYAVACARRNLCYSNEALKQSLEWRDKETAAYIINN